MSYCEMSFSDKSADTFALATKMLPAMMAEFGPEDRARRIILDELAERKTIICSRCKYENKIPRKDQRMFLCQKCRKEIWVTAGTCFHKVELFFPRLATIRLYEMGICISANQAVRLFGISSSAAGLIVKTAAFIAASKMSDSACKIPTEYSLSIVCRRTNLTPAQKPPIEEELALQKEGDQNGNIPDGNGNNFHMPKLSELELLIFEMLREKPIEFDRLVIEANAECGRVSAAVTMLELNGLVRSCPGDKIERTNSLTHEAHAEGKEGKLLAADFNSFIKDHFQGIGRKYLQLYAALYWLSCDRETWKINSLRKLFVSHQHVSYQDILDYLTPLSFQLVPSEDAS